MNGLNQAERAILSAAHRHEDDCDKNEDNPDRFFDSFSKASKAYRVHDHFLSIYLYGRKDSKKPISKK